MCGIIGYVGKRNALPIIIDGLKTLEYRGYDSAGIAYVNNRKIKIIKEKGKIVNLENILDNDRSNLGIGHTRWATHGIPNQINSHPHSCGKITLVHNGIIENYEALRNELVVDGYTFKSETDSEVACAMIDKIFSNNNNILKSLNEIKNVFRGSYAFGIIVDNDFNNLYAVRKNSPLIIGIGKDENFIASDVPAILKWTNKYLLLDNDEIAILNKDYVKIFSNLEEITKEINIFSFNVDATMKNGYPHFMLKEINEQCNLSKKLIDNYLFSKESLLEKIPNLSDYNKIDIVACGSAYHSGLVGKFLIEEYSDIPVNVCIASEYRYNKLFIDEKTLVILVSQSGETADTLACLRIAKEHGCSTLGIINAVGSSIAREVDNVLYINAGCEVAVATTKAYTLQVLMFSFIALAIGLQKNKITDNEFNNIKKEYNLLPNILKNEINKDYINVAKEIFNNNNIFFIGRSIDYAICMEGSLKLKEISYIHSECYAAGELKHGTISLIENGTPVISVITNKKVMEKTISNIKEVKARGAYVILIISKNLDINSDFYDIKILVDNINISINSLISIIPLQLLSYEIAKLRNCDIDKPKNLAKSVTVE